MPAWARDHNIWLRAKKAALADYSEDDDAFYSVVTSIYKKMGGKIGGSDGTSNEVVRASATEMVAEAARGREAVTAAGTSEGVRKAWETRKRGGSGKSPMTAPGLVDQPGFKIKMSGPGHGLYASEDKTMSDKMAATGTSEGARKGWEGRGRFPAKSKSTCEPRVRFNRGYHDAAQGETEGWHNDENYWGFAKEFGQHVHSPEDVLEKHFDPHYAQGWYHGVQDSKAGKYKGNSEEAWKRHQNLKAEASDASPADTIRCRASFGSRVEATEDKPWKQGEAVTFVYLPEGKHPITAGFRDGSIKLHVEVDRDTAAAVQSSLEGLRAERPKQRPYGCVEHREQEASVIAKQFGYEDGRGVVLTAEPTALGASNVNGRIHWSWSPSFTTDAEYDRCTCADCGAKTCGCAHKTLEFPAGARGSESNPARVTGVDFVLGTLTNRPAFREMPPVKGSDAVQATGTSEGAGKGWENRARSLHDEANAFSAEAITHSSAAKMAFAFHKSDHEDNAKAAASHRKAAEAHEAARVFLEEHGETQSPRASGHLLDRDWHRGWAGLHEKHSGGIKASETLHAHCGRLLYAEVPDATPTEEAEYERLVDGGSSHSAAVEEIRARRKKTVEAAEPPTLEAIYASVRGGRELAKQLAEAVHSPPLTLAYVYKMRTVKADE